MRDRVPDHLPREFPVGIDLLPFAAREVESLRPSTLSDAVDASRWRYHRGHRQSLIRCCCTGFAAVLDLHVGCV